MKVQLSISRNNYSIETAVDYDDHYSEPIALAENQLLKNLIGPLCDNASVLDIGAGTGFVADITEPSLYAATDLSGDMLKVLTAKHRESFTVRADLQQQSGIDAFIDQIEVLAPFDVITSIFAAHLMGSNQVLLLRALRDLLNPGGTLVWHGNWPARKRRKPGAGSRTVWEELGPGFNHDSASDMIRKAGYTALTAQPLNALPDTVAHWLPAKRLTGAMRLSQRLPKRMHYHGAIVARKPVGTV